MAWLVDGRRYLGAGAALLALGSDFIIARETTPAFEPYQFALLFGLLGAGALLVHAVHPAAVQGFAGALLFTSASAALMQQLTGDRATSIPQAWGFVVLMVVWGGIVLLRALAGRERQEIDLREPGERPLATAGSDGSSERRPMTRT